MEPDGYCIEPGELAKLRQIRDRLYGDGRVLTADERRDLAHRLGLIIDQVTHAPVSAG